MHPGNDAVQERAGRILDFIIAFKEDHDGLSPTYREIMDACDISSTSIVARYIDKLESEGEIECLLTESFMVRGIMISGGKWKPPAISRRYRSNGCDTPRSTS